MTTEQLEIDGVGLSDDLEPRNFDVKVIRSSRRTKTAQAKVVRGVIEVRIPSGCSAGEEAELVDHFVKKFERSHRAKLLDLDERAGRLAKKYDLPMPASIRWVSNQKHRWGSCTPSDGTIRLSDRLAGFPEWVIDYVVVHELAHLVESGHGPRFWALVEQYPLTERARGFLMAKGLDGVA